VIARGWVALAASSALAAVALALSTELSLATRLVFHLHPIAILAGSALVYRRLNGGRAGLVHAITVLVGLAVLLSAGATEFAPARLADPPWLAAPIAVTAFLSGGWVLLRRDVTATVSSARRR
jgi:hypothetical protein